MNSVATIYYLAPQVKTQCDKGAVHNISHAR